MASITFAVDEQCQARLARFPWVNWSEVAREELLRKEKLEDLRARLLSEKDFTDWSVKLGRKAIASAWKRVLSKLTPEEKRALQ